MMCGVKMGVEYQDYEEHKSIQNLDKFLLHSSIREQTRNEDEKRLLDTFNSVKIDLIVNNIDAIKKYNYYAEKNQMEVCPVPEGFDVIQYDKLRKDGKKDFVPQCLKKICEIEEAEHPNQEDQR